MKQLHKINKRLVVCFVIILMGSLWSVPNASSGDELPWWNNRWSFRQEILLPIDTGRESAAFQPIDIPVEFDNQCWAKTEEEHSIRVIYQEGKVLLELDSQIYDLVYEDNTHISSCSLVFLIPSGASGAEHYYVYYHNEATPSLSYRDQVVIDESYYQYEPIQGLSFESQFYKITEGNTIVYAISQGGFFLDSPICQQVTKMKPNVQEVRPNSGEAVASFDLVYWHLHGDVWKKSSTSEQLISKELMVDGNLMVKFGIVSQSADGLFRTTAIYKYYYCPIEEKRINVHVKHELLNYPVPLGDEIDVYYIILRSGGIRSNSIDDLNFGSIPPYLHVFNEENRVITYTLDQHPENYLDTLVVKTDDCDLGSPAWVSVDHGQKGSAHAIIFDSNEILQSGTDETDGIEVQVYESKVVQLPGLEGRFANVCLGRNSYESDKGRDDHIPKDFIVEFDAEFFSTSTGGYEKVNKEAQLYQALVAYQPSTDTNITNGEKEEEYSLTVYAHLPQSLRGRWRQAMLLGQTPPCLFAAIYHNNALRASGGVSRLAFTKKMTIDWKNVTFFRKIRFNHLEEGKYVVKIWLINPFDEKKYDYIGFQILNITQNGTTHIWCKPQGKLEVTVTDQQENGLSDARVLLLREGTIIAEKVTNAEGIAKLGAPCGIQERYQVQILYDGFELENEEIRLGYIRRFLPVKKMITIDVHDLTIDVRNEQGGVPSVPIDVSLTSDSMSTPTTITPDDQSDGQYRFRDLYTATYQVQIDYSPFSITRTIDVTETSSLQIMVYDVTVDVKDKWGLVPAVPLDIVLESDEFEHQVIIPAEHHDAGSYLFANIYPANYSLRLSYKSFMVDKPLTIPHTNETIGVTFPALFSVTLFTLDARGNMLSDANVEMEREGKKVNQEINEQGAGIFVLPPGTYSCTITTNGSTIAMRDIDVTNEKTVSIVTTAEPLLPTIIVVLLSGVLVVMGLYTAYHPKKLIVFIMLVAVCLSLIAVVSPWWGVANEGNTANVETSTSLFLWPTELVTVTSTDEVTAGETAVLDGLFIQAVAMVQWAIVVGSILLIASIITKRSKRRWWSSLLLGGSVVLFVGSLALFIYSTSQLAEIGVGSFSGSGEVTVAIPGQSTCEIGCTWGPSSGFYLFAGTTSIILGLTIYKLVQYLKKKVKTV